MEIRIEPYPSLKSAFKGVFRFVLPVRIRSFLYISKQFQAVEDCKEKAHMQTNQWKTASAQLLKHWNRSGISQFPAGSPHSVAAATAWLGEHASTIFEESEPPNTISASVVNESGPVPPATLIPDQQSDKKKSADKWTHQSETPSRSLGKWNSPSMAILDRQGVLDSLNDQVIACRKCEEIVCRRQRTVFGVGATSARVVMFGEAPGAEEDRVGEPFVGAAGQLLDKILVASGLKREDVYIVNALKCRPPNNRTPTDAEIENCRPFFENQLETIQPEYIVCWGSVAVRAVLGSTDSVGRLRGKFHSFRGAKVLVTYHPAYLLRAPDAKKLTWEDMKMLMKDMGIAIPAKG